MPKRKKLPDLPDYFGLPKDYNKLVVQKSNPLQTLSETEMSLVEFKILDAYLSRIDSHNEEKRYVRFEKGELERILGVTKINKSDLEKRLKNLFQTITIKDESKQKGFTIIALFEKAEAVQDADGYILYLYLENNRFRKSWKISLDELKKVLNCNAESYTEGYKDFNKDVLKKCQKELHEKTNLRFSYFPTDKKSRTYKSIQFTVETLEDKINSAENPYISDSY